MKALPDFSRARVLIAGDVMLDRYWFGDVSRISPEAPVPVVHVKRSEERPGGAANVARNITALEGKATLLAVVGDDEAAASLERLVAGEQALQGIRGFVGADHGEQRALPGQRGDVARHVGRAAGPLLGALHVHHRHRRLG